MSISNKVVGADYRSNFAFFRPPAADMTVCCFLDQPDGRETVNYGTAGDLVRVGRPPLVGGIGRKLDLYNYYIAPVGRVQSMTIFAVYKDVLPVGEGSNLFASIISSQRNVEDGGRRGVELVRTVHSSALAMNVWGTNAGAPANVGAAQTDTESDWRRIRGQVTDRSVIVGPGNVGAHVTLWRDGPVVAGPTVGSSTTNTTIEFDADDPSVHLMIGSSPRGVYACAFELAFIGIVPRQSISDDETAAIWAPITGYFEDIHGLDLTA